MRKDFIIAGALAAAAGLTAFLMADSAQAKPAGPGEQTEPSPWDTTTPTEKDLKAEEEVAWVQYIFDSSRAAAIEQMNSSFAYAGVQKLKNHQYQFDQSAELAGQAINDLWALGKQIDAELAAEAAWKESQFGQDE